MEAKSKNKVFVSSESNPCKAFEKNIFPNRLHLKLRVGPLKFKMKVKITSQRMRFFQTPFEFEKKMLV